MLDVLTPIKGQTPIEGKFLNKPWKCNTFDSYDVIRIMPSNVYEVKGLDPLVYIMYFLLKLSTNAAKYLTSF